MNTFDEIHQVLSRLINENKALHTQAKLLDSFVVIARSSGNKTIIKSALQKVLAASMMISQAENGSMFLFDENGCLSERILTREIPTNETLSPDATGNVLNNGLAGWVMRHRKVGHIEDTHRDVRWVTHPDQLGEVRSALSIPIKRGNRLSGLITLQHSKPYKFNREIVDLMRATADQVSLVLENIELYAKLEGSYRDLNRAKKQVDAYSNLLAQELKKGQNIQKEFLPEETPVIVGWRINSFFKPAMQLSGDFFDIFRIDKNHMAIVIADVCDKGVGAALYMALFRSLVRIFSGSFHQYSFDENEPNKMFPAHALKAIERTNDYIANFHGRMATFATIFFGILDTTNGELVYINAGQDPPAILRGDGKREMLMPTGPAVGAFPEVDFRIEKRSILPGDLFFGYTDGVPDAVSQDGEAFGKRRLEMIMAEHTKSRSDFETTLKESLFDHIGAASQADDITFMVIERSVEEEKL